MTVQELGAKLQEMHANALPGDHVTMIYLFGIKYAEQIKKNTHSKRDIADAAGIQQSYATEISKGVKLAKYVIPKN